MDKVEKIKIEVERRILEKVYTEYSEGYNDALKQLLSFIDSLEEESEDKCKGCNNVKGCVTCVDGSEWAHYHYDEPIIEIPFGARDSEPIEEPVSKIWHDASEKPREGSWVCVNRGGLTLSTFLYDDGKLHNDYIDKELENCKWAYPRDLINVDNICNFGKNLQEEPVSEELEVEIERINKNNHFDFSDWKAIARHFANWQKKQDQETIEVAEDHAMLAGIIKGTEHTIGNVRSILNKVAYRNNGLDVNGDYCEQPYVELDNEFRKLLKEE